MSFRFENPMDRVVTFWAKIVLGPSDSQIRFCPIEFCHIGLHENTDPFRKNLKFGIGSHENQPYFDVTMWWYRVDVAPILPMFPVRGYVLPNFRSVRYRYPCCTDTCTNFGTDVHTGTGLDIVPNLPNCPVPVFTNLPKCPVPVFMSYRTYRRVRYRY